VLPLLYVELVCLVDVYAISTVL